LHIVLISHIKEGTGNREQGTGDRGQGKQKGDLDPTGNTRLIEVGVFYSQLGNRK